MIDRNMFAGCLGLASIICGLSIAASVNGSNSLQGHANALYQQSRLEQITESQCGQKIHLISLPVPESQIHKTLDQRSIISS